MKDFEKVHGRINSVLEFSPTTGTIAPQKNPGFYVYNLSESTASADDFNILAQSLAALR